jgi:hypothetical protein
MFEPIFELLMAWEDGVLDDQSETELFQRLIDCDLAWTLQGVYGRKAVQMIKDGRCRPRGE